MTMTSPASGAVSGELSISIDNWLRAWHELTQNPDNHLLDDSLPNIVDALLNELRSATPRGRRIQELARQLRAVLTDPSESQIDISRRFPVQASLVQGACSTIPVAAMRSALATTLPNLQRAIEDTAATVDAIVAALTSPTPASPDRYAWLSSLLIRVFLRREEPSRIAALPERILASESLPGILQPAIGSLTADWTTISPVESALVRASRVGAAAPFPSLDPVQLVTLRSRYSDTVRLAMATEVVLTAALLSVPVPVGSLEPWQIELGRSALAALGRYAALTAMDALCPITRGNYPPHVHEYASAIGDATNALDAWMRNLPGIKGAKGAPFLASEIGRSLRYKLHLRLAENAASAFALALPAADAGDLGKYLSQTLPKDVVAAVAARDIEFPIDGRALRGWGALRETHHTIRAALAKHASALIQIIHDTYLTLQQLGGRVWAMPAAGSFWMDWVTDVVDEVASTSSGWNVVNWSSYSEKDLRAILAPLATAFQAAREYDVVLTVKGINPDGQTWTTGDIHWYDPKVLDLGETWLSAPPEVTSDSARAWRVVRAASKIAAERQVADALEAFLGTLTFVISDDGRIGTNAHITSRVFRGDIVSAGSQLSLEFSREQTVQTASLTNAQVKDVIEAFDPFSRRAADPKAITELDRTLVTTLTWYRTARFDPNAASRFLAFYVALEHVFTAGKLGQKWTVPRLASEFLISWFASDQTFTVLKPALDLARQLRQRAETEPVLASAMNSVPCLAQWRVDLRQLLVRSAVTDLGAALPADPDVQDLKRGLDQLASQHTTWITVENAERQRLQFRLERFYDRRNAIVHEALVGAVDMKLYADAVEKVISRLVRHIMYFTTTNPPLAPTLHAATAYQLPPWLE